MAREVTITLWCDRHMVDDVKVEGDTHSIAIDTTKTPVEVDMCKECWEELAGPLLAFLDEQGVTPRPSAKQASKVVHTSKQNRHERLACPECGEDLAGRPGVQKHLLDRHGIVLAEWESKVGHTIDGRVLQYQCDWKGCGLKFGSGQGLGLHRTRAGHRKKEDQETLV